MRAPLLALVAFVAAVSLASVAAAGPDATKQRVAINMKIRPQLTFVLTPLQAGTLKRDSGTLIQSGSSSCRNVIRDGQKAGICPATWTLTGKRGSLTIRERNEWVDPGHEKGCGVAFGTWKVLRGTGEYAGIAGGGRSAHEALCSTWYARQEGFLTVP